MVKWVLRKFSSDTFDHHLTVKMTIHFWPCKNTDQLCENFFTWNQIIQGVPINCSDLSTGITASIGVSEPSPYDILNISNLFIFLKLFQCCPLLTLTWLLSDYFQKWIINELDSLKKNAVQKLIMLYMMVYKFATLIIKQPWCNG